MKEEEKIKNLIKKCFRLGQGGWNNAEDETEYIEQATEYAESIGLLQNDKEIRKRESIRRLKAEYTAETGETKEDLNYMLWLQNKMIAMQGHIK